MIAENTGYRDSTGTCGAEHSSCDDSKFSGGFLNPTEEPAPESQTTDAGEPPASKEGGDEQQAAPPAPTAEENETSGAVDPLSNDKTKLLKVNVQDPNKLLDSQELAAMKTELSNIFAEIDVEVVFTDSDPDYAVSIPRDREGFSEVEDAVGSTPANRNTGTVSNYGYVFINQLTTSINSTSEGKAAAGQDSKAIAKGLGRAAAHEIGHYLLQQLDHSTSGAMRKGFVGDQWFSSKTRGLWQFSDKQKITIRSKLPDKIVQE